GEPIDGPRRMAMSVRLAAEPECSVSRTAPTVSNVIDGKIRELGGLAVRRVLPSAARRMVGPFTFLDEMMGRPFAAGEGFDVPPHPHIGLATGTYLFEGGIVRRDSLGSQQPIRPGDINWMTAGRGIAHSERTPPDRRVPGARLHGLQMWVALPQSHEEDAPSFRHHPGHALPVRDENGVRLRVLAGETFGMASPVATLSPLFCVDATMSARATISLPG